MASPRDCVTCDYVSLQCISQFQVAFISQSSSFPLHAKVKEIPCTYPEDFILPPMQEEIFE